MKFEQEVLLLGVRSRPYDFKGKSGVGYSATVSCEGSVFLCKTVKEVYEAVKDLREVHGEGRFLLTTYDNVTKLTLTDFTEVE